MRLGEERSPSSSGILAGIGSHWIPVLTVYLRENSGNVLSHLLCRWLSETTATRRSHRASCSTRGPAAVTSLTRTMCVQCPAPSVATGVSLSTTNCSSPSIQNRIVAATYWVVCSPFLYKMVLVKSVPAYRRTLDANGWCSLTVIAMQVHASI